MILNQVKTKVTKSNNVVKSGFTIKASSQAFKILSSNLYSDPQVAIIREISTNALDSHKESGVDKPFSIHVPTQLEPSFSVRDYGKGLSHEKIVTLYTTYFDSTKSESNDSVGGLGLGSKSPLGYCDLFNVNAYGIDGIRHYAITIGEEGLPEINFMGESESDGTTGLEVIVPINDPANEYLQWQSKMKSVYKDFPLNMLSFENTNIMDDIQTSYKNMYSIHHKELGMYIATHSTGKMFAKMGCVLYPINIEKVLPSTSHVNNSIIVDFNIGDLSISPNREELHYDSHTISSITSRISNVKSTLEDELQKALKAVNENNVIEFINNGIEDTNKKIKVINSLYSSLVDTKFVSQTVLNYVFSFDVPLIKNLDRDNGIQVHCGYRLEDSRIFEVTLKPNFFKNIYESLAMCESSRLRVTKTKRFNVQIRDEVLLNPDNYKKFNFGDLNDEDLSYQIRLYKSGLFKEIKNNTITNEILNKFKEQFGYTPLQSLFYDELFTSHIRHHDLNTKINLIISKKGYITAFRKYDKNSYNSNVFGDKQHIEKIAEFLDDNNVQYTLSNVESFAPVVTIKESMNRGRDASRVNFREYGCSNDGSVSRRSAEIDYFGEYENNIVLFTTKESDILSNYNLCASEVVDIIKKDAGYDHIRFIEVSIANYKRIMNLQLSNIIPLYDYLCKVKTLVTEDMVYVNVGNDFIERYNIESDLLSSIKNNKRLSDSVINEDKTGTMKLLLGEKHPMCNIAESIYGEKNMSDVKLTKKMIKVIENFSKNMKDDLVLCLIYSELSYKINYLDKSVDQSKYFDHVAKILLSK